PAADVPASDGVQTVVLSGGCFWGVQGVFQHTAGVVSAVSGYSGGSKANAQYELVSTGTTGHAESVEVKVYPKPIVTKVSALQAFYPAESYHQDYLTLHPSQPYIAYNDLPKVENLKKLFAENYQEKPTLVRSVSN